MENGKYKIKNRKRKMKNEKREKRKKRKKKPNGNKKMKNLRLKYQSKIQNLKRHLENGVNIRETVNATYLE